MCRSMVYVNQRGEGATVSIMKDVVQECSLVARRSRDGDILRFYSTTSTCARCIVVSSGYIPCRPIRVIPGVVPGSGKGQGGDICYVKRRIVCKFTIPLRAEVIVSTRRTRSLYLAFLTDTRLGITALCRRVSPRGVSKTSEKCRALKGVSRGPLVVHLFLASTTACEGRHIRTARRLKVQSICTRLPLPRFM